MPCIWIDANAFLGFWKLREGRLQSELLPAITELSEHILITRQVSEEVLRNSLSTFLNPGRLMSPYGRKGECRLAASSGLNAETAFLAVRPRYTFGTMNAQIER
jgi:hypothetical protein